MSCMVHIKDSSLLHIWYIYIYIKDLVLLIRKSRPFSAEDYEYNSSQAVLRTTSITQPGSAEDYEYNSSQAVLRTTSITPARQC